MGRYVIRRLLQLVPVLIGISLVSFTLMYVAPGDPALMMLTSTGQAPTPDLLAATRASMGLDRPFLARYASWAAGVLTGDLGYSFLYNAPVAQVLATRLPVTLALSVASLAVVVAVSVPLGIAAALHRGRAADCVVQVLAYFSLAMPTFWLGLVLIYVFALELRWLPAISNSAAAVGYVLPVVALSFSYIGRLTGQVRADVVSELGKPYITGLVSRGVPARRVIWRHAVRNALLPSLTVTGLAFGAMLSGSITTEMVFSLQGLGALSVQAVLARDYALVQAYVLITAVAFVMVNLACDLLYHALNPRVRLGGDPR